MKDQDEVVSAVRRFSRFYTRRLGLLHEGLLGGPLPLTEARIIYELGERGTATATQLGAELELDSGYLSRLLRGLEERGLIDRRPSPEDGRQVLLSLTPAGRTTFAGLDARSRETVAEMLRRLPSQDRQRLTETLSAAEGLLSGGTSEAPGAPFLLRPPNPGDYGWVVHRHGALYAREYGFDTSFEALVAEIVAQFVRAFDPQRERCWIAERQGAVVGSAFLVRESEAVGKLRLVYVEPEARGLGIGRAMVGTCVRTARALGYARLTLWTNDVLVAARRIYQAEGFRLVSEERHHSFGRDLVGEYWALDL
ncbi:bifunctional helix-turn-helix transcriptional regulator/GNAT family N-acetyltransferase [Roseomonas sp. E05]|uniref:bifunctional helix-turn-helix transcriptional regulator/GNAT family N-acetyltransferase n=1 Tax=Roseomonas sp. E05 TaxID=3046310 RepID=UPI0024BBD481|nr:bifunctional helix-turn-helix transcriptional regulator/GNAT family N-acetyltransferase [Roseomonas sp. E05]MDJ0387101.1 bifunctional helix-turn-helix transcriptional regulator/GNAT family N-acetyltransferase [Roseomonas sp. E05]